MWLRYHEVTNEEAKRERLLRIPVKLVKWEGCRRLDGEIPQRLQRARSKVTNPGLDTSTHTQALLRRTQPVLHLVIEPGADRVVSDMVLCTTTTSTYDSAMASKSTLTGPSVRR